MSDFSGSKVFRLCGVYGKALENFPSTTWRDWTKG